MRARGTWSTRPLTRLLLFVPLGLLGAWSLDREAQPRWYRGNTHTHTLWSDGNATPEAAVDWYASRGYDFLALTDHNVWLEGESWFPVDGAQDGRLSSAIVEDLRRRFGEESVRLRQGEGGQELRLATLDELRERFEAPGEFVLIGGEEITGGIPGRPVHVNGINLDALLPPTSAETVAEVLAGAVRDTRAQGELLGRPVLAHVNHPNFGWGVSEDDLAGLEGRFVEIYNGHPAVRDAGDATHPSTEALWDAANARRRAQGRPLLWGVATDDAHDYQEQGLGHANPGRGWIMVRARELSADAIVAAVQNGDYYSSSGVTLDDVHFDGEALTVDVAREEGIGYEVRFMGCELRDGELRGGALLATTSDDPAVYRVRGDEGFVRAQVVSTRPQPNPAVEGDLERAWTRPFEVE